MKLHKLSRRDILKSAGVAGASIVLIGCSAPSAPAPLNPSGSASPSKERKQVRMWYQAENHKPEYERRKKEFEKSFDIELTYELLGRDAMGKKLVTTLMSGSDVPDIVEQNADDIVKYMKGNEDEF